MILALFRSLTGRLHGHLRRLSEAAVVRAILLALITLRLGRRSHARAQQRGKGAGEPREFHVSLQRLLYQLFAILFFTNVEGWTAVEAIYFSMVTMSTVGYGDLAPTIWYSQLLGIGFILVGIIVVFGQLGEVVGFVIEPFFDKMREVLDRIWKPTEIEIKEGNKVLKKIKVPARPVIYFTKGLIGPLSILLLFQFLSAIIFVFVEPGWDLWTAWWYVMVTATTVGYGDFSVSRTNNDGGLIWASLHILLSCSLLAALIGDISELKQERREQLIQIKHYLKCHEPETLQALDKDGDQKLRKEEFVLGMLKKIGKLDKEDVQFIEAIFDNIDAVDGVPDGSVNTEKFERAEVRSKMSTERELAWKKLSFCVKQELKYMDVRNAMKEEVRPTSKVAPAKVDDAPPLPPPAEAPPTPTQHTQGGCTCNVHYIYPPTPCPSYQVTNAAPPGSPSSPFSPTPCPSYQVCPSYQPVLRYPPPPPYPPPLPSTGVWYMTY
ncbi:unnamed protein product [Durusdinium trenchii]|uniref:Potassium channel domain-containing protein n=2 Tax=Durusdinium trenchii TaxID=1381693 RepID=A0ABP0SZC6_9DINO